MHEQTGIFAGNISSVYYPPTSSSITVKELGLIKPKVYTIEYEFKLVDLTEGSTFDNPILFSTTGVINLKENQILKDALLMKYATDIAQLNESVIVSTLYVHVKELNRWLRE